MYNDEMMGYSYNQYVAGQNPMYDQYQMGQYYGNPDGQIQMNQFGGPFYPGRPRPRRPFFPFFPFHPFFPFFPFFWWW